MQVSSLPIFCKQIEGLYKGAAAAWLQVHDSCITPAAGAVPIYELPLNPATQFQETLQVDGLSLQEGLFVGVSSTEGTFTASASTMDVNVWTDVTPIATNIIGDKTTLVGNRQAWAQTVANKRLYSVILTELNGTICYIYGTALSAVNNFYTANPGLLWILKPNQTKKLYFGANGGISPLFNDIHNFVGGGAGVVYTGCSIQVSTSQVLDFSGSTQIFFTGPNTCAILLITN